jgi:methylmalonyl-CoA mutase cobalamin-binding domain/chain
VSAAVTLDVPLGRVLITKLGLDGHDVGAKVVSRVLRDAGFEVIYLGIRQTPEAVASVAIDEDVDLVGVSMLSGAHLALVSRLVSELRKRNSVTPVVVGGAIPTTDHAALADAGVAAVIDSQARIDDIVETVRGLIMPGEGQP